MPFKEYDPVPRFPVSSGRTIGESQPAWPRPIRAKPGTPNVLYIVLEDTGYGHLGCYGLPVARANPRR
jgi:arylsulfatase